MIWLHFNIMQSYLPYTKTPRVQMNTGCFIACLIAVLQHGFWAIRSPANPHKYWLFESLLAFFNCSLWCSKSSDENNHKTVLNSTTPMGGLFYTFPKTAQKECSFR